MSSTIASKRESLVSPILVMALSENVSVPFLRMFLGSSCKGFWALLEDVSGLFLRMFLGSSSLVGHGSVAVGTSGSRSREPGF